MTMANFNWFSLSKLVLYWACLIWFKIEYIFCLSAQRKLRQMFATSIFEIVTFYAF